VTRQKSDSAGQRDYDGGRIIKEQGEYAAEFGLELHGSVHKRAMLKSGQFLRHNGAETPKPRPWSRGKRRP